MQPVQVDLGSSLKNRLSPPLAAAITICCLCLPSASGQAEMTRRSRVERRNTPAVDSNVGLIPVFDSGGLLPRQAAINSIPLALGRSREPSGLKLADPGTEGINLGYGGALTPFNSQAGWVSRPPTAIWLRRPVGLDAPCPTGGTCWVGGTTGNWSTSANWSNGVPTNVLNAFIDNGNAQASAVTLDINGQANQLTIDSDDSLSISNGHSLTVYGNSIVNSNSTGSGGLTLNAAGSPSELIIGSSNVTLAGGGTVTMSNNGLNYIQGSAASNTLTNQETIQGAGDIGNDEMALSNAGTINANQSSGLTINTSNGFTNSGTVEATNGARLVIANDAVGTTNSGTMQATVGGTLVLSGNSINNASGTIQALTASTVELQNGVAITGGTLTTIGNGTIVVPAGQTATLSGLTISGNYSVSDGASTTLNGTINLTGNMTLNSTGDPTELVIGSPNITLSSTGAVTMSNNSLNYILGSAAANTLTNHGTIQGSGDIGNAEMALSNAGTINANQAISLTINTSNGFTNTGTVEATNGATLTVVNDAVGTTNGGTMQAATGGTLVLTGNAINNAGGTIRALNSATPSTVSLQNGVAITGGTLTTAGNGTIVVPSNQSATLNGVTISGNYSVSDGGSTTLNGTINFTGGGTISLNGVAQNTALIIGNSNATIGSGGTVTMSNFLTETGSGQILTNAIYGSAPANTLTNKGTIQGAGLIGYDPLIGTMGAAQMALVNSGTINANQSAGLGIETSNGFTNSGTVEATNPAGPLYIDDATAIINSGTIEAAPGTTLFLEAPTVTNTGGAISASHAVLYVSGAINGGNVTLTGAATLILDSGFGFLDRATIQGATVTNSGTGTIEAYGPNNTLGGTLINPAGGQIRVDDVSSLTLAPGAGSNLAGTISIVGTFSTLTINGSNITLPGSVISSGSLIIGASNLTLGPTATLTMSVDTAYVYGSAAANTLTNQGTIVGTGSLGLAMGQAQMALVNSGTINDNEPFTMANGSLIISTSNGFVNSGTVEATNGAALTVMNDATGTTNTGTMEATAAVGPYESTLVLSGNSVNNTGGVIEALASSLSNSEVDLQNGVTITGGTLTTAGNGEIDVLSNQSATLNSLTMSGRTHVFDGGSLTLEGSIENTGALSLFSNGHATSLLISGEVTLTGGGAISLSPSSANSIVVSGATGADTLTNINNIIQGAGTIGSNMALNNQGTIDANVSAALTLQVSNGVTNTGTLEATSGGTLVLNGGIYTNTGGTILAGTGSVVQLENGAHIVGGTLASTGTGFFESLNSATLQGLTNTGTYVVPDGNVTTLVGTINNTGSLQLNSSGLLTQLLISGNVILNGSGTVTLSNNANNLIRGASTGNEVLTNNSTVRGAGNIGDGFMGLVNTGTILANQSTELFVYPSTAGFNNHGIVAVSAGSALDITGPANSFLNFDRASGTLTGGSYNVSGTLQFDNANIVTNAANITLNGAGSEIIDQGSNNGLANFATNAAGGVFTLAGGRNFTTAGNFTNTGALNVGSGSTFDVNGNLTNFSGTTLTGGAYNVGGTLQFNGANIVTDAATITLNGASSQIIDQTGANALANLATVAAGGSFTVAGDRTFITSGNFTNNGLLAATNGGNFITPGSLANHGMLVVGNGSALLTGATLNNTGILSLSGDAIVQGSTGTQTLTNAGLIEGSGNIGFDMMGLVNTGTILANQSTTLVVNPNSAGFTNQGNLVVNGGSTMDITGPANSFLNFNSGTGKLTGGNYTVLGTLQFDNANIVTNAADITLLGAGSQIVNQSSANALANFATNAAGGIFTLAGGRNFTTGGNFTNNGGLVVDAGSEFTVDLSDSLTNFSGTTLTGGTYRLYGGTLQFNGANIVTNAANITLSGTTSEIINGSGHNALANFATNAALASFILQGGLDLTTNAASFTNNGYLGVGTGSTFTVGTGSYTQNASGLLDIAIAATTRGTTYGSLDVTGTAALDGALDISLIGSGSLLTVGESFDIVTGHNVACGWSEYGLAINSSEHFQVDCTSNEVMLDVVSGAASGWFSNPPSTNAATPEPGSLFLFGTALLALSWGFRRRLRAGEK